MVCFISDGWPAEGALWSLACVHGMACVTVRVYDVMGFGPPSCLLEMAAIPHIIACLHSTPMPMLESLLRWPRKPQHGTEHQRIPTCTYRSVPPGAGTATGTDCRVPGD